MSKSVHVYGYAFTGHGYKGTTGAYYVDFTTTVPTDTNIPTFLSMLSEFLENEHIKLYKDIGVNEAKGQFNYGVAVSSQPPEYTNISGNVEDIAQRIMDNARRVRVTSEGEVKGVKRNATERREFEERD